MSNVYECERNILIFQPTYDTSFCHPVIYFSNNMLNKLRSTLLKEYIRIIKETK